MGGSEPLVVLEFRGDGFLPQAWVRARARVRVGVRVMMRVRICVRVRIRVRIEQGLALGYMSGYMAGLGIVPGSAITRSKGRPRRRRKGRIGVFGHVYL